MRPAIGPLPPGERLYGNLAGWSLVLVAFSFVPALWLDFAPTPGFGWTAYAIAVLLAALHLAAILAAAARAGRLNEPRDAAGRLKLYVYFPIFFACFYWPLVFEVVPAAYTAIAGEPFVERFEMHTEYDGGRHACDYQLEGEPMGPFLASHLCITYDAYARFPDQPVIVELVGRRTRWGRYIRTYEIVGPASP